MLVGSDTAKLGKDAELKNEKGEMDGKENLG